MRWFAVGAFFLESVSNRSDSDLIKFIALFFRIPFLKGNQFSFDINLLNQRRLRLLCGEDLFAQLYGDPLPRGGIVHILKGLSDIKHRLETANPSEYFCNHQSKLPPNSADLGS